MSCLSGDLYCKITVNSDSSINYFLYFQESHKGPFGSKLSLKLGDPLELPGTIEVTKTSNLGEK